MDHADVVERQRVGEAAALCPEELARLCPEGGLGEGHAERMVENALGVFGLAVFLFLEFLASLVALEVGPDAKDPAAAALEALPGWTLRDRSRRLRAWVLESPQGALCLWSGERSLSLTPGCVSIEALEALDRSPPHVPVDLVFRGPRAQALREDPALPLEGRSLGQQRVETPQLWPLLEGLSNAGCRVSWGAHAAIAEGLIVESA